MLGSGNKGKKYKVPCPVIFTEIHLCPHVVFTERHVTTHAINFKLTLHPVCYLKNHVGSGLDRKQRRRHIVKHEGPN